MAKKNRYYAPGMRGIQIGNEIRWRPVKETEKEYIKKMNRMFRRR